MKKFLKENWFVAVIAVFFVAISIYYAYDQNKDNLPAKSVNGKDVVVSADDYNVTADDLYDQLYKTYGKNKLFMSFYKAVIDANIETTDELQAEIDSTVSQTVSYYTNYYGYGISYLNQIAQYYYGYNDFTDYVTYQLKAEDLYAKYIEEHATEFVTDEFISTNNPHVVSYCLIKMDDPSNPTEDDLQRLEKAKKAFAEEYSADTFADFAKAYSEDSSTADAGGKLGYVDVNSSLVDAFKNAALALNSGEVTDWIFDENYGYFLIKCDSTSYEDYKDDANFLSTVLTSNDNLSNTIVWSYAKNANVTFADESVKDYILSQLGNESED